MTICAAGTLTVCTGGSIESMEVCALGCAGSNDRCLDVDPSNNLASKLDGAADAADVVFGPTDTQTTINTDTGDVVHNGTPIAVPSARAPLEIGVAGPTWPGAFPATTFSG